MKSFTKDNLNFQFQNVCKIHIKHNFFKVYELVNNSWVFKNNHYTPLAFNKNDIVESFHYGIEYTRQKKQYYKNKDKQNEYKKL